MVALQLLWPTQLAIILTVNAIILGTTLEAASCLSLLRTGVSSVSVHDVTRSLIENGDDGSARGENGSWVLAQG